MVDRAVGYYGAGFKIFRGVIQGYPIPPTIFNVVVDVVASHWISLVEGGLGGQDRRGEGGVVATPRRLFLRG